MKTLLRELVSITPGYLYLVSSDPGSSESSEIIPWTFTQTNKTQSRIILDDYRSFETSWINQELAMCVARQTDDIFALEWKQNSFQATSDFELSSEVDVVIGQCGLTNKCADISCEHGGTCRHVSSAPHVYCDCDNTGGYTGATCRTSNTWRSCGQYLEFTGERSVLAITRTDWNDISL